MKKLAVLVVIFLSTLSFSQVILNDANFFHNSIVDASINPPTSLSFNYMNNSYSSDYYDVFQLAGIYNFSPDFVFGFETSADYSYREPLIPYFSVGGRYNLLKDDFKISFGGLVDIPINQDEFFYSVFTSVRYKTSTKLELTGSFRLRRGQEGFNIYEEFISIGGIYSISKVVSAFAEIRTKWEVESMFIGGGVDYNLFRNINLRGAAFVQTDGTDIYTLFFGASYNLGI